jgi:hypothetical protein
MPRMNWRRARLAGRCTLDIREELGPDARKDAAARWLTRNDPARAQDAVACRRCGHHAALDASKLAGRILVCTRCGQKQRA